MNTIINRNTIENRIYTSIEISNNRSHGGYHLYDAKKVRLLMGKTIIELPSWWHLSVPATKHIWLKLGWLPGLVNCEK